MALVMLLHAMGYPVTALSVDHGLRAESAAECAQVAAWMEALGIAHHTLVPAPLDFIRNVQTRAREMRYAALTGWCRAQPETPPLLLAHHAEDQAETVALQCHRGTSSASRSGMPLVAWRSGVMLVRPLLGVRKASLRAYLEAHGQAWLEDPTNASGRYARNRLRSHMTEEAMRALWQEAQRMGETRHREDAERNAWFAAHAAILADGAVTLDYDAWYALPEAMRGDIISHAIRLRGGKRYRPRHHETAQLLQQLAAKESGKATLGHTIIRWEAGKPIHIAREALRAPLDAGAQASHMKEAEPLKTLESKPFWWFNPSPYF